MSNAGDGGIWLNAADAEAAIQGALSSDGGGSHLVLVTSCFDGIVRQLKVLARCSAFTSGRYPHGFT